MQLLSTWGGGLWILPILTITGTIIFGYLAYASSKSNSTKTTRTGIKDNTGNVPLTQIGYFWFAAILLLATIAIILAVNVDK